MDKSCLIFAGAPFYRPTTLFTADLIIACDLGLAHAEALGVKPHLIIGDFDSYAGTLPEDIEVIKLPVRKDDTDTGYALRYALSRGYRRIHVTHALGGRLDHSLANLQSAIDATLKGASVSMEGQDVYARLLTAGSLTVHPTLGQSLSILSLTDRCTDVSVTGAAYTLAHATLTNRYPLGVSNHAEGEVTVTVGEGVAAILLCEMR
jgi:thiamine pyrophosphokinase